MPGSLPSAAPAAKERPAWQRAQKLLRKFGPVSLIIVLLFAIKYFLLGIHLNVHRIKANILEQCEQQAASARGDLLLKNEFWSQFKLVGRGPYGFVQWSGHRVSASKIVAVGFGAVLLREHRSVTTCAWHGEDGKSLSGEPKLLYPEEKTDKHQYEPILIVCALTGKVSTSRGGQASVTLDKEHVVLYKEDSRTAQRRNAVGAEEFKCTFCTYPVAEAVDGERMREWLDYHKFVGASHVVAYDAGGMDQKDVEHLEGHLRTGFLEITPMREIVQYDIRKQGKVVAMHDCMYRSALTSAWVAFIDWDDFLLLQSPRFLSILLDDNVDKPWMTYGCRVFSTKLCLATSDVPGSKNGFQGTAAGTVPFPLERMVYHWPHFLCNDDYSGDKKLCPGTMGMRYIIANPREVFLLRESEVREPKDGGLALSAEDVRHDRFEGYYKEGLSEKWCKEPHGKDDRVDWWQKSMELAPLLDETRKELENSAKQGNTKT